jgi:hypothetical protein
LNARFRGVQRGRARHRHVYDSSDYFLPTEFVDQYACKVKSRTKSTDDDDIHNAPDENNGDQTDGTPDSINPAPCADNWKAAAAEEWKRMWAIFEESGCLRVHAGMASSCGLQTWCGAVNCESSLKSSFERHTSPDI